MNLGGVDRRWIRCHGRPYRLELLLRQVDYGLEGCEQLVCIISFGRLVELSLTGGSR
jgi:hypothetical protein